jgi:hypothetical protein
MQRINKNADIRAGGGTNNLGRRFEVRHRGPGKKFQQHRKPITFRQAGNPRQVIGKTRMVTIGKVRKDQIRPQSDIP